MTCLICLFWSKLNALILSLKTINKRMTAIKKKKSKKKAAWSYFLGTVLLKFTMVWSLDFCYNSSV